MDAESVAIARVRQSRLVPVAAVILFALSLSLFVLAFHNFFVRLGQWGYVGTLVLMAVNNATIIFPAVGHAFLIAGAQVMNPWLLGIFGGIGATIGELTAYALGRGGHALVAETRLYERLRRMMRWTGPMLLVFAATPLPFDVVGVLAGSMRYPLWRFLFWSGIGKIIQTTAIAVASYHAIGWLYRFFGFGVTD